MIRNQTRDGRLTRARSWMNAAENLSSDHKHAIFVSLYIAFNAMYGRRQYEGSKDENSKDREEFLKRLYRMHVYEMRQGQKILFNALETCRKEGGNLIVNYFLRDTYWKKEKNSAELLRLFSKDRARAETELKKGNYEEYLDLILRRLAVLRNQVMHGCVTYGRSSKGLPSLENGLAVLLQLVPAFYELMDKYGHHVEWPPIPYPRVGSEAHPVVDQLE